MRDTTLGSFEDCERAPKARWTSDKTVCRSWRSERREMRSLRIYAFLSRRALGKNYWIFISVRARIGRVLRDIIWRATGKFRQAISLVAFILFLLHRLLASRSFSEGWWQKKNFSTARTTRRTIGANLLTLGLRFSSSDSNHTCTHVGIRSNFSAKNTPQAWRARLSRISSP